MNRLVGEGNFSEVFHVTHLLSGKDFALKQINKVWNIILIYVFSQRSKDCIKLMMFLWKNMS